MRVEKFGEINSNAVREVINGRRGTGTEIRKVNGLNRIGIWTDDRRARVYVRRLNSVRMLAVV